MLKLTGATSTAGGAGTTVTASPTSEFIGDSAAVVVVVLAGVVVVGADVGGAAGVDRGATVTGGTAIVIRGDWFVAGLTTADGDRRRTAHDSRHHRRRGGAEGASGTGGGGHRWGDRGVRCQSVRRRATSSPAPLRPRRPAAMASATTVPDVPAGTSLSPVLTRVGAPPRPSMVWV